jgi:AraC family transcriptional regulator
MAELVSPDDLRKWIPGKLTLDSSACGWKSMTLKGYEYCDLEITIPRMRDYFLAIYEGGTAQMGRRNGGAWHYETVERGVITLLTRAEQSQWCWDRPIQVLQLYLPHGTLSEVAGEIYDRDIGEIEITDRIRAEDEFLPTIARTLKCELTEGDVGGRMLVDALSVQACVHVLRRYAHIGFREPSSSGRFSCAERRQLMQYLADNISRDISLAELAAITRLSVFHFSRKFRSEFGCPPHQYLMRERVRLASQLLARPELPLKSVAASSGFADQSHMTRLFRRFKGVTPAQYRRTL